MSNSIFYTASIGFMSGVFLRSFFDLTGYGIALAFLLGATLIAAWMLLRGSSQSILVVLSIAVLCGGCGAWRMNSALHSESVLRAYEGQEVVFEGNVVSEVEYRNVSAHVYIEPVGFPDVQERVRVTADRFLETFSNIAYGDVVSVTGILKLPEAFETDGGRTFDYPGYLKVRDVHYVMERPRVEKVQDGEPSVMRFLFTQKHTFQSAIENAILQPMAGLGEGVLLGVRGALPRDLESAFRTTGIIHIVVLSGYNIMIVVEWLTYVLAFFFGPRMRMVLGIVAIATFVLLVGASATAVRAGVMASLLLVARGTGRTYAVLRALFLAAVCMLIANPFLLVHDPGFQLSFLATIGLIILAPRIEPYLVRIPERFGLRTIVTATLATQIFVLPLLLYQTGLFSVVSLVVNALVLPMVPVAMMLTFVTGVTGTVLASMGLIFGFIASLSLSYIVWIAEVFASLPFAAFSVDAFPFWVVCVLYIGLALFLIRPVRGANTDDVPELASWTIEEDIETPEGTTRAPSGVSPFSR